VADPLVEGVAAIAVVISPEKGCDSEWLGDIIDNSLDQRMQLFEL
jgi:hypothetical protein